jgi:hypothetical protein
MQHSQHGQVLLEYTMTLLQAEVMRSAMHASSSSPLTEGGLRGFRLDAISLLVIPPERCSTRNIASGEARNISMDFTANLGGGSFFLTLAVAREDFTKEDMRFDALEIVVQPVLDLHTSSIVNLDVDVGRR